MLLVGLFICGQEQAIPLKSLSVRAFLQGYVVGFRSTLKYENNTLNPLEVFFRTPVDNSYAVVGLEAEIDGRKIRAEIQEKRKAREMYQEAISSGHTAAFGEEKQGDIFSLKLGNLPPGESASIHLTMVGELAVEPDGAVRFVLPTVLKPRYTPSGSTDPLAPQNPTSETGLVHHATGPLEYEFEMIINGAAGIAEVTSPSHEIHVDNTGEIINVSLAEAEHTDIVILVQPKEPHQPLVIVEPGFSNGDNGFQKSAVIMVSFFPEFKGDSSCLQAACEFVFVVDRSGSMKGSYIKDAAQTLLLFLKSIPEGCYFNVIGFGSSYVRLFPESVPYNQKNMETAVKHAEHLEADLGGTELFDPLKDIFSHAPIKGMPRQVFVLTDGSVSNTTSVIKLVAENSSNSRCFSFGIGSGASSTLVKGIAEAGKGEAEFITAGERMQAKVIRSLKKAMQPAVTDTQISYAMPEGVSVKSAPSSVPSIFVGERLIIYAILDRQSSPLTEPQEGSICLSGDLLGAKVEHDMKFQVPVSVSKESESQVSTIHHLAAKKLIKEMELHSNRGNSNAELIQLSCDSNVICSQTAFIAIDEERKEPVKGSFETWDILAECDEEEDLMSSGFWMSSMVGSAPAPRNVLSKNSAKKKMKKEKAALSKKHSQPVAAANVVPCSRPSKSLPLKYQRDEYANLSASPPTRKLLGSTPTRLSLSTPPSYSVSTSDSSLSTIIDLQLANGSWEMSKDLADVIGKPTTKIQESCPVACKGNMSAIWATIIVLSYLQLQQSSFKDEWELVALKAEGWMAKQQLPQGCSLQVLREKGTAFFS